jgi:hypothetical protein
LSYFKLENSIKRVFAEIGRRTETEGQMMTDDTEMMPARKTDNLPDF